MNSPETEQEREKPGISIWGRLIGMHHRVPRCERVLELRSAGFVMFIPKLETQHDTIQIGQTLSQRFL
jgi:hypothetical protein